MNKTDFFEQYKDPRWQKKRLEIMKRDKFSCKKCNDDKSTLNVHHKKYIKDAKPWEYNNKDLITLCEFCHQILGQGANRLDVDNFHARNFVKQEYTMKVMKYPGKNAIIVIGGKDDWNFYCLNSDNVNMLIKFFNDNV